VLLFRVSNGNSSSEPAQTRVQISQIKLANGTLGADGTLYTTPATDIINALDSDDTVASTLDNLQQDDSIQAGAGRDTFVLLDGTGAATIDLNNPVNQVGGILTGNTVINGFEVFRLAGFAGTATMIGNEQDNTLVGGTGNDWISGGAGNDVLGGNAGNDTLDGGAGDDQLEGGLGDDLYIVDSPNDLIIEGLDQGFDQVQSSVDYTLGNNLEALTLTGTAIVGVGNDLDNQITGNAQNNLLNGGEGNDRLIGLQGRDTLIGGSGKDRFVLTEARRSSRDTIRDFRSVDDTIEIVRNGFSDTLKLGKIRASMFCLGARAADRSDRFIYNRNSGALFFDPDGAGGAGQVQIARLTNKAALHRSDIVIVDA
jgi:Ca2+-binding RTX toxin-like protein